MDDARLARAAPRWALAVTFLAVSALASVVVPAARASRQVVALGDSLTTGYGLPAPSLAWPHRLTVLSGRGYVGVDAGIVGDSVSAAAAGRSGPPAMETRLVGLLARRPYAVVLLGGTNDLVRTTVAPVVVERAIESIAQLTRRSGARFLVCTVPPVQLARAERRWPGEAGWPTFDARLLTLDRWIRDKFGSAAIDLYAHVAVRGSLPPADQADGDGVHLSADVENWLAGEVLSRLSAAPEAQRRRAPGANSLKNKRLSASVSTTTRVARRRGDVPRR